MAYYDRNLNMYRASTGGYFASPELAKAAEDAAAGKAPGAAAPITAPRPPDVTDTTGRTSNPGGARDQDFFGEGAWADPLTTRPVVAEDPDDRPLPRTPQNPSGFSRNDLARGKAILTAQARQAGNTNLGVGGGVGTDPNQAFNSQPQNLTSGVIPGSEFSDSHGREYVVRRQTAQDADRYNAKLDTVEDLGWGGGESAGAGGGKLAAGTASGALAGNAILPGAGAVFGAGLGLAGSALALKGSNTRQLGLSTTAGGFDKNGNIVEGGQYNGDGTPVDSASARAGGSNSGVGAAGSTSAAVTDAKADTAQAKSDYSNEQSENAAENADLWQHANDVLENVGHDNTLGDEARGYQREGLQQQRMLLERMLGFDPNQYATQFADQSLARQIALARSTPGGAGAQQAGIFAAMDQAPSLYAEGARQASSLENQRLSAAEGAAKSFGELGTMTRGQDEARADFESNLSLNIAKQVGDLTQGQVAMNEQDSQRFAEIWMDFAKLQSVYAGMSSAEQIAWWQREAQERGQDKTLEAIMANIKAGGAVSDKDMVAGLFQLGGGAISSYGQIEAAKQKNQAAA